MQKKIGFDIMRKSIMTTEIMRERAIPDAIRSRELEQKRRKLFFGLANSTISSIVAVENVSAMNTDPVIQLRKLANRDTHQAINEMVGFEINDDKEITPERRSEVTKFLIDGIIGTLTELRDTDPKSLSENQKSLLRNFIAVETQGFTIEKIRIALKERFSEKSQKGKNHMLIIGCTTTSGDVPGKPTQRHGSEGGRTAYHNKVKLIHSSKDKLSLEEICKLVKLKKETVEDILKNFRLDNEGNVREIERQSLPSSQS